MFRRWIRALTGKLSGGESVPELKAEATSFEAAEHLLTARTANAMVPLAAGRHQFLCILATGEAFVNKQKLNEAWVQHAIQRAKQHLGRELEIVPASSQQIEKLYGGFNDDDRREATAALATFLSIIEDAASRGVNEVIIRVQSGHAVLLHRKNSKTRKVPDFGMSWAEAESVFNAAFHSSGGGSQHPQYNIALDVTILDGQLLPASVQGLRLHWEPEVDGVVLNVRLAYRDIRAGARGIAALKQPPYIEQELLASVQASGGMIIFGAEPEQGKSTSQTYMLEEKADIILSKGEEPVIWSAEDPIETIVRPIQYAELNNINKQGEELVEEVLARVARWACSAIKLQEIRRPEHAQIALQLAQIGIFSTATIHAKEVVDIPARLRSMVRSQKQNDDGSETFVADRYIALIAQRLIPVLCPHCAVDANILAAKKAHVAALLTSYRRAGIDLGNVKVAGGGCDACWPGGSAGYIDRKLIMEIYRPVQAFFDSLGNGDRSSARRLFLEASNGHSLRLVGLEEVRGGRLALDDYHTIASATQVAEDLNLLERTNKAIRIA